MQIDDRWTAALDGVADPTGPGLSAGLYLDGALIAHHSLGQACVEFGVPIDEHTRFDIASMSKQFTAAAVASLALDGTLSLDDDLRAHLPELALARPVTVGQALRHTAGLPDWLATAFIAGRSLTRITQDQALAFVAPMTSLDFEPGTEFSYSNTGYLLAACLVLRLTGKTLRQFTTERIFGPLGMDRTFFRDDSAEVIDRFAYGYSVGKDGTTSRADSEECSVGDGGLVTCVTDLGPWFGFLGDGRVLGTELRDLLVTTVPWPDGEPAGYALGLYHRTIGGVPVLEHAGAVAGYRSVLILEPGRGLGVAVLANNSALDPAGLGAEILRNAAGLPAEPEPAAATGEPEQLRSLAGHWLNEAADQTFSLAVSDEGVLQLEGYGPTTTLTRTGDGSWRGDAPPHPELQVHRLDDAIGLTMAVPPDRPTGYRRCPAPDPDARLAPAVYRSVDLGTLATVTADGRLRLGLTLNLPIRPAADGAFSARMLRLRTDGDDLLITTSRSRRLRFVRCPDDTVPVGVPAGLTPTDPSPERQTS